MYTGEQASRLGLVDRLGGVSEACELAATTAGLSAQAPTKGLRVEEAPLWATALASLTGTDGAARAGASLLMGSAALAAADDALTLADSSTSVVLLAAELPHF